MKSEYITLMITRGREVVEQNGSDTRVKTVKKVSTLFKHKIKYY